MDYKQEGLCQCEALKELAGDDNDLILLLVNLWASEFRDIINEFKRELGRLPTKDDLIWCLSEREHTDVRAMVKRYQKAKE